MPFCNILGQNKAITLLGRALTSKRLAHAYLFSGPRGVGKRSTALAMTARIFCRNPQTNKKPCGICSDCVKLHSASHPDLLRIAPDGAAIKIDQIRSLRQTIQYPPLEAPFRVSVLEAAQTMRREAANSLLKLLEEPPPDNLLLLLADGAVEQIPATIVSRCQVIPFAPLPDHLVVDVLRRHLPDSNEEHIQDLASLAEGCPGQALDGSMDDLLPLYKQLIRCMLEVENSAAQRVELALSLAGQMPEDEEQLARLLHLLRVFLKNAMAEHLMPGMTGRSEPSRELWNLREISAKVQALDLMEHALARNCNRTLSAEVLLLTLFDCAPPNLAPCKDHD